VATLAGKNAHILLAFSSEWPSEINGPVSAHIASSECATSAGSISTGICPDFSIPYCPSRELVDGFGAPLRMRILAFICSRAGSKKKPAAASDQERRLQRLQEILDELIPLTMGVRYAALGMAKHCQ
jgi:predicted amidohydrolase